MQRQPDEAHERQPVAELVLGLVVGQRVERLQHQDAEHQHRIVGRPAALGAVAAAERGLELGPEQLEVHHRRQPLQRVARRRQPLKPLIRVEEPALTRHRRPPCRHSDTESRQAAPRHGFFEVSNRQDRPGRKEQPGQP